MQKRKFCIGRVKGNFLWQPYTIWTEWRLNSLNMKWMANLLFNYVLSLLYFNVNSAVESCICTAYQKSFRKTKVGFFRFKEYYYILQFSFLTKIKTKAQSLVLGGKIQIALCWKLYITVFFHWIAKKYHRILTFFPDPKRVVSRD